MGSITMDIFSQLVLPLLGAMGGGIGAYIGIRSDLNLQKALIESLRASVERAHERIDDFHKRS